MSEPLQELTLFDLDDWIVLPEPEHCVYVIQAAQHVKIGYTSQPKVRIRRLCQRHEATVLLVRPGSRSYEQYLHRRFRRWQRSGEWFELGPDLFEWIVEQRDRLRLVDWTADRYDRREAA